MHGGRGDIHANRLSVNHSFPYCSIAKRDLTTYIAKEWDITTLQHRDNMFQYTTNGGGEKRGAEKKDTMSFCNMWNMTFKRDIRGEKPHVLHTEGNGLLCRTDLILYNAVII